MTFEFGRRSSDKKLTAKLANFCVSKFHMYYVRIKYILLRSDISLAVFLGGFGLIIWAAFGIYMFTGDLENYAKMFPFGGEAFWAGNYIFCGLAMMLLSTQRFPPFSSLMVGGWVATIWAWSALARLTETATYQTGNATSIIYIILGLLIIQRSARKHGS